MLVCTFTESRGATAATGPVRWTGRRAGEAWVRRGGVGLGAVLGTREEARILRGKWEGRVAISLNGETVLLPQGHREYGRGGG